MHTSPTPTSLQPLETRFPVVVRQEGTEIHVITQTIYRPSTTFVTYVTLGSGPPTSYSDGDPAEPAPPASSTPAPPPPSRSSGSLSSVQIGAILGGVVAFVAIALIAWFCATQNRPRKRPEPYSDLMYDYDSSTEGPFTPPPVRPTRGRGHGVRPYPAYMPPQMPPPPPAVHINQHKPWKPTYNGPWRRQQPPPPQRYRTRVPFRP